MKQEGIYLIHPASGRHGWFSDRNIKLLGGIPEGWMVMENPKPEPTPVVVKEKPVKKDPLEPTREQKIEALQAMGVRVNWNIGEEKLNKRYEDHIKEIGGN